MKKFLGYIYNRVYKIFLYINGEKENPQIPTLWYFTFMILFLLDIILKNCHYTQDIYINFEEIFLLIFFGVVASILYFLTIFKSKYKGIINKFRNENQFIKVFINLIIVSFTVLVLVLFFSPIFKKIMGDL